MKDLHVGQFSDLYFPSVNGVVKVVDKLSDALNNKVHVYASVVKRKHDKTPNYKVHYCKGFKIPIQGDTQSLIGLDKKFRQAVMEEKTDIIHCHTIGGQFGFAQKKAKKGNVPIVITVHTQTHWDLKKFFKADFLVKKLMKGIVKKYNSCDEVWALNEGIKNYCISWGVEEDKIRVVGNACDYTYPENADELINNVNLKYNIQEDETVFCFLGRLIDYKNIYFIADSLKVLKDKGVKFKMFYIGDGIDRKKLEKRIESIGLEKDVILTGTIKDREQIAGILLRSKLFLFPSMFDAFPLVVMEASAHKTPSLLVGSSVAASGYKPDHNVFTAKEDVNDYADKIYSILSDDVLYEKVKENCYKETCPSWDKQADFIITQYEDAIEKYKQKLSK